jgi:Protein of unknown function (DUF5818)
MLLKPLGFMVGCALVCVLLARPTAAQTGADQRRASGEKSVTGCLERAGSGFALRSPEGTYELNTDRDLSAFVGKQVRISGRWEMSGTVTTAAGGTPPTGGGATSGSAPAVPAGPAAAGEQPQGQNPAFVGDLHLHVTGTVLGDCTTSK